MAVVNDVFFIFCELENISNASSNQLPIKPRNLDTHILPNNRPKTRNPQNPLTRDPIHKHTLTRKHRLTDPLALVVCNHALGAGEEGVFADAPLLLAGQLDDGDVADGGGCEEKLAGTCVRGFCHFAADDELFEREFYVAF